MIVRYSVFLGGRKRPVSHTLPQFRRMTGLTDTEIMKLVDDGVLVKSIHRNKHGMCKNSGHFTSDSVEKYVDSHHVRADLEDIPDYEMLSVTDMIRLTGCTIGVLENIPVYRKRRQENLLQSKKAGSRVGSGKVFLTPSELKADRQFMELYARARRSDASNANKSQQTDDCKKATAELLPFSSSYIRNTYIEMRNQCIWFFLISKDDFIVQYEKGKEAAQEAKYGEFIEKHKAAIIAEMMSKTGVLLTTDYYKSLISKGKSHFRYEF